MRIAFYPPFKPLGHPNPSGDLVIATGLVDHLRASGNEILDTSDLRARWIYWKPWKMLRALSERRRISLQLAAEKADLWLTYHTYYKAPDLLGPAVSRRCNIPYVIFQGMYSTKVRRRWRTRPGYALNNRALLAADLVLTNRRGDLVNLQRRLPSEKIRYLAPGINPAQFTADPAARKKLRSRWRADDIPVILSAAMFRSDVKTQGLIWVIESCSRLIAQGLDLLLVIAGDGREKKRLTTLAGKLLGDRAIFAGRIPREHMAAFYSASDIFAFPGINESLGMVFLEAQSCGLPVVAFDNAGVPEVVKNGITGLLTPPFDRHRFDQAVASLLNSRKRRLQMGDAAAGAIRAHHDLARNYRQLEQLLGDVVTAHQKGSRK